MSQEWRIVIMLALGLAALARLVWVEFVRQMHDITDEQAHPKRTEPNSPVSHGHGGGVSL